MTDTDLLTGAYERWLDALASDTDTLVPTGCVRLDAHTHVGVDSGSGLEMTFDALERQMRTARVDRAVLIPLNASDGYHRDSLRLIARAAEEGGDRYRALYRVDPSDEQLDTHVRDGLDAGAVGLKLHPVSDDAHPLDPRLEGAWAQADERGCVVLVHTGVDVARAALDAVEAARRHPGARVVLGHLPAEALSEVAERASDLPNLWVCASWWGPLDVAYAMRWFAPERLLLGTDPPYGNVVVGTTQTVRVARALGWDDAQVAGVVGGNAERMLAGELLSASAPRSPEAWTDDLLTTAPVALRRCYLALIAAVSTEFQGGDGTAYLRFAAQALEPRLIPGELEPATAALRRSIGLAGQLAAAGRAVHAYAVGTGALTQALTIPTLVDR